LEADAPGSFEYRQISRTARGAGTGTCGGQADGNAEQEMKAFGYLMATLLVMAYAAIMNGWALTKLWAWFIVPGFDAPPINIPMAIGICVTLGFLTKHLAFSRSKPEKPWSETLIEGFIWSTMNPIFTLGIASIVKLFM
jgi:hypothetical protein